MAKKIEVEYNGRIHRVSEHMLETIAKFGATTQKRTVVNTPKELIKPAPLPDPKTELVKVEPETKSLLPEPEKKNRKAPVRSKAKK
jgi:hypothetical protein